MKIKSLLIGLSTALLAAAPIATSFTPPANAGNVDEFFNNTVGQLRKSQNREGFVKGLANRAFYYHQGKLNIMVFNLSQGHSLNLKEVQYFKEVNYNGVIYGVWAFKGGGTFTNTGDGGFKNWTFLGNAKRGGKDNRTVTFKARS